MIPEIDKKNILISYFLQKMDFDWFESILISLQPPLTLYTKNQHIH